MAKAKVLTEIPQLAQEDTELLIRNDPTDKKVWHFGTNNAAYIAKLTKVAKPKATLAGGWCDWVFSENEYRFTPWPAKKAKRKGRTLSEEQKAKMQAGKKK